MYKTEQLQTSGSRELSSFYVPSVVLTDPNKNEVRNYLMKYITLPAPETKISRSKSTAYLGRIRKCEALVHYHKVNNLPRINDFLRSVNGKLPAGGTFAFSIETLEQREKRIFNSRKKSLFYYSDFVINRVLPKLKLTKNIYFHLNRGANRVISMPEILGRLVYCGFKLIDFKEIGNLTYIIAEKENIPLTNLTPSYGLLIKMRRIGKEGRIMNVYKFRTMYPYSEFIQKLVYDNNNIKAGGKLNNDYRITPWGSVLRKYWLDELPMIINWFKGDLKIVGLRPLSQHYFSLYKPRLRTLRYSIKPGLIPPYYCDMPTTLEEIMTSEEKYIEAYTKSPHMTDLKYFYYAIKNILFKGARSS